MIRDYCLIFASCDAHLGLPLDRKHGSLRRPGCPRKLTPQQEVLLMRRVEENRHASSLQLSKEVESQIGVTICRDTIQGHCRGWHACVPSLMEASPKAQAKKSQGPCWKRWRLLGLYTLEWWDQDKCFGNWWLQNCMVSQLWGIQRKMHGAYSETWWLHECCWCRGAAFHWWHHEFTDVLLYTERKDATIESCFRLRIFIVQSDSSDFAVLEW